MKQTIVHSALVLLDNIVALTTIPSGQVCSTATGVAAKHTFQ
jgi:hypothetical protein